MSRATGVPVSTLKSAHTRFEGTIPLRPAIPRPPGWKPPRNKGNVTSGDVELVPIISDPHCPLHEKTVTDAFGALLAELRPARAWLLGDNLDAPSMGRHRKNMRLHYTFQECIDSLYDVLVEWRAASPGTKLSLLTGNHCEWKNRLLIDSGLEELITLAPAHTDTAALSMEHLLRLDELDIDIEEPDGQYFDSVTTLAPETVAMHGVNTGVNGGAVKEIGHWEANVLQGHDHKQSLNTRVRRLADGSEVRRFAFSVGSASQRDLGYSHTKDVAQGFGVLALHANGAIHPEMAAYDPQLDCVTWRSWIYQP